MHRANIYLLKTPVETLHKVQWKVFEWFVLVAEIWIMVNFISWCDYTKKKVCTYSTCSPPKKDFDRKLFWNRAKSWNQQPNKVNQTWTLSSPIGISTSGWCSCLLWSTHHPCITQIAHTYKVAYKDDFSYILFLYSHCFIPFLIDFRSFHKFSRRIILSSPVLWKTKLPDAISPYEMWALFYSIFSELRAWCHYEWIAKSLKFSVKIILNIHIKIIVVWHGVMICPNSSY